MKLKNNMETKYTLEYFIQKFSNIDENLWVTGIFHYEDKHCAFGHCGSEEGFDDTEESRALLALDPHETRFDSLTFARANDGAMEFLRYGTTPKQRVVNYLKSLRDGISKNRL